MFYSSNGNFFYKKNILEFFDSIEDLVNSYKEEISYSNLEADTQKNLDTLINYIVQEGNDILKKYSDIEIESERLATKKQIKYNLKKNKETNDIITTLKRMTEYNGGSEYLDSLYYDDLSLFNNIVEIEGWNDVPNSNTSCDTLKTELFTKFEEYNKYKKEKDEAELNIINIKKQLMQAQQQKNLSIKNINNSSNSYNDILIKLKLKNCG